MSNGRDDEINNESAEAIEDALQVNQLEDLCIKFTEHAPEPEPIKFGFDKKPVKWRFRQPGLVNKQELKWMLRQVLPKNAHRSFASARQVDALFAKLDTSSDGFVDWNELCTYILLQLREKISTSDHSIPAPVHHIPRIKHLVHNRQEPTTRVLVLDMPIKYVTISKEGSISVIDGKSLRSEKNLTMQADITDSNAPKRRFKQWVTDAAYLTNVRKFVLATTGRDLRFFDATSTNYNEEFAVYGLSNVPCCLHYEMEISKPSLPSTLMWGDDTGNIHLLTFLRPTNQLFDIATNSGSSTASNVCRFFFKDFNFHDSKFISYKFIESVHPESVRRINYISESEYIISSSAAAKSSVVVIDPDRKKKTYTFKLTKSIECFALSKQSNILVTGGNDRLLRIWNPYVVNKPISILYGHSEAVLDVSVHDPLSLIFSYSRDAVVKIWDCKEQLCVQTVNIHFTCVSYGRLPDHGPFPIKFHSDTLLVACSDYIAQIRLGRPPSASRFARSSHSAPLSGAIYNGQFGQVISAAQDSSLAVWDIHTGRRLQFVRNAHGREEITSIGMDTSGRRIATGAINGSVNVWSTQTCHQMHHFKKISDDEITGIVHLPIERAFLTVGWSRKLATYDDASVDTAQVTGHSWGRHTDDILAVSHSPPSLIATGTFDGEISIWSLETESIFARIRRPRPPGYGPPRTPSSRPGSRSLTPTIFQPAPVDALLFLQNRIDGKNRRFAATLLSSDNGYIYWWRIHGTPQLRGKHLSASSVSRVTLCLATDETNNDYLFGGDSAGYVFVWKITNFLLTNQPSSLKQTPDLHASWSAHYEAVVSVDYANIEDVGEFVLTASNDHTVGLWTLNGQKIGIFGQRKYWDLTKPLTWNEPELSKDIHQDEEDTEVENNIDLPNIETANKNNLTTETKIDKKISRIKTAKLSDLPLKRSHTILGLSVQEQLSKVTFGRASRRRTVESLNTSSALRVDGSVCCPYQALNTPILADTEYSVSFEKRIKDFASSTVRPSDHDVDDRNKPPIAFKRTSKRDRPSVHLPIIKHFKSKTIA